MSDIQETLLNTMDSRRSSIFEAAETATSDAFSQKYERVMGVLNGFSTQKLAEFLSLPSDERKARLEDLGNIQEGNEKAHTKLITKAQDAEDRGLELRRENEKRLAEAEELEKLAESSRSLAKAYKEKVDDFAPKIAKLSQLNKDLGDAEQNDELLMDLPKLDTWTAVKEKVKISTKADVLAVNTINMAKIVIKSFNTRGLIFCAGYPKGLVVDRNWNNYRGGLPAYHAAIAAHLKIDMSEDMSKRSALSLMEGELDEPDQKRARCDE